MSGREEFEKWAISYRGEYDLPHFILKDDSGEYIDGTTRIAWQAWKAARASGAGAVPEGLRERLFSGWPGCSNHDCIVTGPKKGMGTNGSCGCIQNAGRSGLNILKSRIKNLLATHPHNGEQDGEWVRCDEQLPTSVDADSEGNVWARVAAHNEVSALPPSIVQVFSEDGKITHWMPTGLKRPAPPEQGENK